MTIRELREILDRLDVDERTEVRLMTGRDWPFEYDISGVWVAPETAAAAIGDCAHCGFAEEHEIHPEHHAFEAEEEEDPGFRPFEPDGDVIYLLEGRQLAYGAKQAWEEAVR